MVPSEKDNQVNGSLKEGFSVNNISMVLYNGFQCTNCITEDDLTLTAARWWPFFFRIDYSPRSSVCHH